MGVRKQWPRPCGPCQACRTGAEALWLGAVDEMDFYVSVGGQLRPSSSLEPHPSFILPASATITTVTNYSNVVEANSDSDDEDKLHIVEEDSLPDEAGEDDVPVLPAALGLNGPVDHQDRWNDSQLNVQLLVKVAMNSRTTRVTVRAGVLFPVVFISRGIRMEPYACEQ
ncbi:zinc finger E-box-binding homeobox 1 [Arapaima gigas]